MSIKVMCVCLVEGFLADSLETETAHHGVEEDLKEVHVIPILLLHDLDPLYADGILNTVELGSVLR
jgi:hypothetical protein